MANERVIVIGAGSISNAWFPNIVAEKLDVRAVVDISIDAARRQIEKYALPAAVASNDLDATLKSTPADFLIDLTIPDAHCNVTCRALAAGLHVIGEKPMAATMDQARLMVAASLASAKMYMVSQSRRWDANHAAIASIVAAGSLGQITTVCCDFFLGAHFGGFRDEMASPLILDMAIHHFDQLRMFTGLDAASVYCEEWNPAGSWYRGDVAAMCSFVLGNGARFIYRGCWASEGCHTGWDGDWRIIGTQGTLMYVENKLRGQVVDRDAVAALTAHKLCLPLKDLPIAIQPMPKTAMTGGLDEMLQFLRTGRTPQTHCRDNINSLAMVQAAIQSSRTGGRVTIEP